LPFRARAVLVDGRRLGRGAWSQTHAGVLHARLDARHSTIRVRG
jgi:hypothetical protein